MRKFCKDLKKRVTKIINYEKKEMIILTKKKEKKHNKQKKCYICKNGFSTDDDDRKYNKLRDHYYYTGMWRGATHNIWNLRYKISKKIPVVFHNGSTYDYHFIIKKVAKKFEEPFEGLGENTEKYISFSVLIKKQLDNGKTITYKIKFIDSFRFILSSLYDLVDNLSYINCEKCNNKREYIRFKDNYFLLECSHCNAQFKKDSEELIKIFRNTQEFCDEDINKFILLLRKGVYPYEYMNNWERPDETSLPNKEAFYSNLNMEDIIDVDYEHADKVFKKFKLKNLGEY